MTKDAKWVLDEKYDGDANAKGFAEDCVRLASGEPVAYVIGWQPFLGLNIYLDSHPLIPRPETEWWTEQLLSHVGRRTSYMRVLDLCAGSGAIGCAALKMLPRAEVFFGEIDPAHEKTILKNIRENNLDENRAHINIGDLFAPFSGMRFDAIACNPPYVPESRELDPSVAEHEPALALRSGEDGLDLIRRIALDLSKRLNSGGVAWIECDTAHAAAACTVFSTHGLDAEIRTDQFGEPRVLVVSLP